MILGIDEVGRGSIAGPLVLGAVILNDYVDPETGEEVPSERWQSSLTDSKKLSPKKRKALSKAIKSRAVGVGLGWVSAFEIDQIGMSKALCLGSCRAVKALSENIKERAKKSDQPEPKLENVRIVIDGTVNFLKDTPLESRVENLVQADQLIKAVSAASIFAKVSRDHFMIESAARQYPDYGFESHVGYGTARHMHAIDCLGPSPIHRLSIKSFNAESPALRRNLRYNTEGAKAERAVAAFLEEHEHHQVTQLNFRTKYCEIDIVSETETDIYFTEVKFRREDFHGSPKDFVTIEKLRQMNFAAEVYLHNKKTNKNPHLAVASVLYSFDNIEWFVI